MTKGRWKKIDEHNRMEVLHYCMSMFGMSYVVGKHHDAEPLPLTPEDAFLIAQRLDKLEQMEKEQLREFVRGQRETPA